MTERGWRLAEGEGGRERQADRQTNRIEIWDGYGTDVTRSIREIYRKPVGEREGERARARHSGRARERERESVREREPVRERNRQKTDNR